MSVIEASRAEEVGDHAELAVATPTPLPNVGLILDAGRQRRKQIKQLRQGRGQIAAQVAAALAQARQELGVGPETEIVPVVLLYRYSDPDIISAPTA